MEALASTASRVRGGHGRPGSGSGPGDANLSSSAARRLMRSGRVLHQPRRSAPRGRAPARPAPATPSPAGAPRLLGALGVSRRQAFPFPSRTPSLSVSPYVKRISLFRASVSPSVKWGKNFFPSQDGAEEKKSKPRTIASQSFPFIRHLPTMAGLRLQRARGRHGLPGCPFY